MPKQLAGYVKKPPGLATTAAARGPVLQCGQSAAQCVMSRVRPALVHLGHRSTHALFSSRHFFNECFCMPLLDSTQFLQYSLSTEVIAARWASSAANWRSIHAWICGAFLVRESCVSSVVRALTSCFLLSALDWAAAAPWPAADPCPPAEPPGEACDSRRAAPASALGRQNPGRLLPPAGEARRARAAPFGPAPGRRRSRASACSSPGGSWPWP